MHKVSRKTVQDLAADLVRLCLRADTETIRRKALEIYEVSVMLNYLENHPKAPQNQSDVTKEQDSVKIPQKQEMTKVSTSKEIPQKQGEEKETIKKPLSLDKVRTAVTEVAPAVSLEERVDAIMKKANEKNIESSKGKGRDFFVKVKEELPNISKEDEFKDAISADVAMDLFEREETIKKNKKSLNDKLSQNEIKVGLNDRIAFVKHLFNGQVEDFNRVLSQLNTFGSEREAINFIQNKVQPEYDWTSKEAYVLRFFKLVESKFL